MQGCAILFVSDQSRSLRFEALAEAARALWEVDIGRSHSSSTVKVEAGILLFQSTRQPVWLSESFNVTPGRIIAE